MIYISIISHNHFDMIKKIGNLAQLRDSVGVEVIIRDNVGESDFEQWCKALNFTYILNSEKYGFGKNNNLNFSYLENNGIADGDYFLVLNPDVSVTEEALCKLSYAMSKHNSQLATINLFLDQDFSTPDNCVRKFPRLLGFLSSFIFGRNKTILNKSCLDNVSDVDWAAGSFLMFSVPTYKKLEGFDEDYFMYCEDIDICKRFNKMFNRKMLFFKQIRGVHYAQFNNRKILSKHFYWHVKSCLRYLLKHKD